MATINDIKNEVNQYGSFLDDSLDTWKAADAQRILDVFRTAGARLLAFAGQIGANIGAAQAPDIFHDVFGIYHIRRATIIAGHPTWYAENSHGTLDFSNKAFFKNPQPLHMMQSHRFPTDFDTPFLVTHEFCHNQLLPFSHPVVNRLNVNQLYMDGSQPIAAAVAAFLNIPVSQLSPENSIDLASAGFLHAARTQPDRFEFTADAVANWLHGSFTADQFGPMRSQQLDAIMTQVLGAAYP